MMSISPHDGHSCPDPYNMIKATFNALEAINSPRMVAAKRGKKVGDIVSRRENTANAKLEKEEA